MKRALILLLSAVLMTAALTGCSSGEEGMLGKESISLLMV